MRFAPELLCDLTRILQPIFHGLPESTLYLELTTNPGPGQKIIGKGEAAAISLARYQDGIVASNNLRDISPYIKLYKLENITTGDILLEAYNKQLISESEGNRIWAGMLPNRQI